MTYNITLYVLCLPLSCMSSSVWMVLSQPSLPYGVHMIHTHFSPRISQFVNMLLYTYIPCTVCSYCVSIHMILSLPLSYTERICVSFRDLVVWKSPLRRALPFSPSTIASVCVCLYCFISCVLVFQFGTPICLGACYTCLDLSAFPGLPFQLVCSS